MVIKQVDNTAIMSTRKVDSRPTATTGSRKKAKTSNKTTDSDCYLPIKIADNSSNDVLPASYLSATTTRKHLQGEKKKKALQPQQGVTDTGGANNGIEIWINGILPFVGPGNFVFVAGVCKKLKEFYEEYFSEILQNEERDVPMDVPMVQYERYGRKTRVIATNTFYSSAFSSVACAKFWDSDTKEKERRRRRRRRYQLPSNRYVRLPNHFVCETVAKYGNLQVLQWARQQKKFPWDWNTTTNSASRGHLKVLKWARTHGCPWNNSTFEGAARAGHLKVLKWARASGYPYWGPALLSNAAAGGHLRILKWLRKNGFSWNDSTCSLAAGGGHLKVLKWARAHGCPWNEFTCSSAADGGHLHVLKWAREHGCPWDQYTLEIAIDAGHEEIVEWARSNGCPEH